MKRTPLARKTPLRRKTWMRQRSKKNSYRRRPRDMDRMKWTRRQPCCMRPYVEMGSASPCSGRVEADHAGARPFSQKASDETVIPICTSHHRQRTDYTGFFKGWDAAKMRAWCDLAICAAQASYLIECDEVARRALAPKRQRSQKLDHAEQQDPDPERGLAQGGHNCAEDGQKRQDEDDGQHDGGSARTVPREVSRG